MKEIIYVRLDDRLVHGQIVAVWLNEMKIDTLLVIDDVASKDNLRRMLLEMAVPKSINFLLLSTDEAAEYMQSEGNEKIFVIFGGLQNTLDSINKGIKIPELNLGNIGNSKDRKQLSKAIWLTEEETDLIREIVKTGTEVNIHLVPQEKKQHISEFI